MLITILGPDGTGKTTLAKLISAKYSSIEYIYFGNNLENRKYKFFSRFLYANKQGKINTFFKYIFIFINDLHYFNLARNNHIISDRCPIDKFVSSNIHNNKLRMYYHSIILKILPNPDYVILLEGDPDIIYSRKKEISVNKIINYISLYKKYIQLKNLKFYIIDSTKHNIQETFSIASKQIDQLLNEI
jgi:thymidylate kinase